MACEELAAASEQRGCCLDVQAVSSGTFADCKGLGPDLPPPAVEAERPLTGVAAARGPWHCKPEEYFM